MAKGVVKTKPENFVSTYHLFWNHFLANSINATKKLNRFLTDFLGIMAKLRGTVEYAKVWKHTAD